MDITSYKDSLAKRTIKAYTKEQYVATQLYEYYHKKEKYPALMGLVKRYGERCVWEIFNELIKENRHCDIKLLKWKLGQIKIKMKEI